MVFSQSNIFEIGESGNIDVVVPTGYPSLTVSLETYTIPDDQDSEDFLAKIGMYGGLLLKSERPQWWQEDVTSGVVSVLLQPVGCIRKYLVADGAIDLSSMSFFSTSVPVDTVFARITTAIVGCTHVVLNITGHTV